MREAVGLAVNDTRRGDPVAVTLGLVFISASLCHQAEAVLHVRAQQLVGHHGVEPHRAANRSEDRRLPHQPGEGDGEERPLQSGDRYVATHQELDQC